MLIGSSLCVGQTGQERLNQGRVGLPSSLALRACVGFPGMVVQEKLGQGRVGLSVTVDFPDLAALPVSVGVPVAVGFLM